MLPDWLKQEIPDKSVLERQRVLTSQGIRTVCQEAKCPNLSHCFRNLNFTFIILGPFCTRNCRFCAVDKTAEKEKLSLDLGEPFRIAKIVKRLNLDYVIITSVTRDDLDDGGAGIFVRTVELIRRINKEIKIELLIPDFKNSQSSINRLLGMPPDVIAHNIETVPRLYKDLRQEASYGFSLSLLKRVKELSPSLPTKSSIMLGLGEQEKEVIKSMQDLRDVNCDILTLGQYLAPSGRHYPVQEFISPEQFKKYEILGIDLGFKSVLSGPLVRSSYQAKDLYYEFSCV